MSQNNDSKHFDRLLPDLIKLGFAFYGTATKTCPDLERTIISTLRYLETDKKVFRMLLRFGIVISRLINFERLKYLLEHEKSLTLVEKVAAFIFLSRLAESGQKKAEPILKRFEKSLRNEKLEIAVKLEGISDPYLISKEGTDPALLKLGIEGYKLNPVDEKKVLKIESIIEKNRWLKLRVLIGPNYRADVFYLKSLNHFKTRYELWRCLGSSQYTAYRIFSELELLGDVNEILSIDKSA